MQALVPFPWAGQATICSTTLAQVDPFGGFSPLPKLSPVAKPLLIHATCRHLRYLLQVCFIWFQVHAFVSCWAARDRTQDTQHWRRCTQMCWMALSADLKCCKSMMKSGIVTLGRNRKAYSFMHDHWTILFDLTPTSKSEHVQSVSLSFQPFILWYHEHYSL